jgi:hypothetical protein
MPQKMERFTQRARRVLSFAQEEAERLQHSYIGTEHMLLGLMREEGSIAGRVLRDLGLDPRRVEELVERMTRAEQRRSIERLDLSPGTKRVLELAVDEARRMGHYNIGTEHLLLGLVRQGEGITIDVLKRLNISPEEVKRQIRRVLQESPVKPAQTTRSGAAQRSAQFGWSKTPHSAPVTAEVMTAALEEAKRFGDRYVGMWHVLIALLRRNGGAATILRELGLDEEQVLEKFRRQPTKNQPPTPEEMEQFRRTVPEFTPSVKQAIEVGLAEAKSRGAGHVEDQDLLLGLIRVGSDMFEALEILPEAIRFKIYQLMHDQMVTSEEEEIGGKTAESTLSSKGEYMDEKDVYRALVEAQEKGQMAALATVVRTQGSLPRHAGSKMLVYPDGRIVGTVGGGAMEARIIEDAKAAMAEGQTRISTYTLNDLKEGDPGVCGGTVEIFIEPLILSATLAVIGCGHVGKALAELGKWLNYRVIVSDDRAEFCNPQFIPNMGWLRRRQALGGRREDHAGTADLRRLCDARPARRS